MDLSAHEGGGLPIPMSSSTYVGQSHSHHHSILHDHSTSHLHHHQLSNGPTPPPPPPLLPPTEDLKKVSLGVKYRECLKNHAASIGGNATDGCGEFMPSGDEGTLEVLKCSACNCHRNFHRKEVEGDQPNCSYDHYFHHLKGGRKLISSHQGLLISRPTPHSMIMPLGAAAMQTSESDEMEGVVGYPTRPPMMKKRFRTKFSAEQKEKMLAFAEKAGWKLQKQEESEVQQLCQEIGVKRRVLKVWMHNNKHNLAKKNASSLPSSLDERTNE